MHEQDKIIGSEREKHEKTVLVTGGAGFIGSNFIRYWLENHPQDSIVNLDLLTYAGNLTSLDDVTSRYGNRYSFIQGNIGNTELVDHLVRVRKPTIVVNFAAESHNSRSIVNPGLFFETNVMGTQRLLDVVAHSDGVERFHHISTCEVYGDLDLESDQRFTEESPYRPKSPYNSSKASADMLVRAYHETFGVPVTISNCSNNYGPYQFPEKLIPHFITSVLEGKKMTLYKQSHNKREWLHVDDHCRAIDLVINNGNVGETYNIGSGTEVDIETVAAMILNHLNLDGSYKSYVEDRPSHDRRYLLDASKIRSQLGWEPKIEFEQGLYETINWYLKNRGWWEPLIKKLSVEETSWAEVKK